MHGVAFLLLAAVGGYWVLERSQSHRGNLKRVGQIVGGLILILSLVGSACKIYYKASGRYGYCYKQGKYSCPFAAKQAARPSETK